MTFDELKAAYAAGATIQIGNSSGEWFDLNNPMFDAASRDYRVKPTEETEVCTCDSEHHESHTCPYGQEIDGDETECSCCRVCEQRCADSI